MTQRLGDKLHVQGGLHESLEGIARTGAEGIHQLLRGLFEQEREDLGRERGRGGGYLGVDEDETEQRFVDVWFCGRGARFGLGDPVVAGEAGLDDFAQAFDWLLGVGLEEAGVNLAEDVFDGLGFVGEFDGEGVFEL